MIECTQQHAGQIGRNSRIGIVVSQGQLDLRTERVAGEQLEVAQPYQRMLSHHIVPFFDLRPVGVNRHEVEKNPRSALIRASRKNHVVAGFEWNAL